MKDFLLHIYLKNLREVGKKKKTLRRQECYSPERKVFANYSFPANPCSYRPLTARPGLTPGCSATSIERELRSNESSCNESKVKAGRERNAAG